MTVELGQVRVAENRAVEGFARKTEACEDARDARHVVLSDLEIMEPAVRGVIPATAELHRTLGAIERSMMARDERG